MNKKIKILLRSGWQCINIGDVSHSPGAIGVFEKFLPGSEVILWADNNMTHESAKVILKRFPKVKIVFGRIRNDGRGSTVELDEALRWCDILVHGSSAALAARHDMVAFTRHFKKPFGVFGITYDKEMYTLDMDKDVLSEAEFVFFRDSLSLERAKADGVKCPVMEFGPDAAFGTDLSDDYRADIFMRESGLEERKFLCCIPRLRYSPYWLMKPLPFSEERHKRNEEMKEHDHAPLREAIIKVVRETGLKILVCPEDCSQMAVGKEMIMDKLPEDVKEKVVWRSDFWLLDEALSIYKRSAGLFGNEMHSPIICVANGIPAIVCRWKEQTTKGYMWRDIGLSDWLFDMDVPKERAKISDAVLDIAKNPQEAFKKTAIAREYVLQRQKYICDTIKNSVK